MSPKPPSLYKALQERQLVRFDRPVESGSINGYVTDIGPKFFMIALVSDSMRFDGFQCFRRSDVRRLRVPAPYAAFAEAALRKRGERFLKKPRVDLSSVHTLLLTASKAFPLVTIHREMADKSVCHIGRVARVAGGFVWLLEIGPDARWDKEPERYRLDQITRVDFGSGYEEALHLVGGGPENPRSRKRSS